VMVLATTADVFGVEVGGRYEVSGSGPHTLEVRVSGT
jgi:hypothetical protein